jgi:LacI family transcriptional regulator
MGQKKLTMKKIAELAGVSKATVSRVLNDYPHIRTEVRERVLDVVQETGYQRNNVARMLASDRSNMIGLVIPSEAETVFSDPYFPTLTRGISFAAITSKQTLALFLGHSDIEAEQTIRNILANGLLDGIIITADHRGAYFEDQLVNNDMPFVFIGRPEIESDVHYVDTDNVAGGRMATDYLIERGYRRIGIIGSNKNVPGDDRYRGYQEALLAHGLPLDESLVAFGDYSMESGVSAMQELIPAKPDAVFVTSDTMALGALRTLREHDLHVPDDIAIVGYDDLPPAVQADPQLTTVRQPIEQTGHLAVETLLQLIENPQRPLRQIQLPNELIVRDSTA